MFSVSIIEMFVYKEVTSNDTIALSYLMGTFLMLLENVVEFLALLFSFFHLSIILLFSALRMLAVYLFKLYNGEPLYKTIGRIGNPGLSIFD